MCQTLQQKESEAMVQLKLDKFLPEGWRVNPTSAALQLVAPDEVEANLFARGGKKHLHQLSERLGTVEIVVSGLRSPIARFKGRRMSQEHPADSADLPEISSYAPARITFDSDYDEIADFIKGKKAEGLIVTATSMISDKCLMINDLQVLDRGGSWTGDDWIGLDFKKLWRDSFHIGRINYYGALIQGVERDRSLPNFFYHIRRPSGALAEYSSTYHLVEDFLGIPARIAVSVPGDWRIIEAAPDGSE